MGIDMRVHRVENVDGDPHRLVSLCGELEWSAQSTIVLDPNRKSFTAVTCTKCMAVLEARTGEVDEPIIVRARGVGGISFLGEV